MQNRKAAAAAAASTSSVLSGFLDIRHDPPRLVATIKTLRHAQRNLEVSLHPVPNIASPSYLREAFSIRSLLSKGRFDKILLEDGRLPVKAGSYLGSRQQFLQKCFPFVAMRQVVEESEEDSIDGLLTRDGVETRMAFQMLKEQWDPPVDPRARRGVERIASYPDGSRVCVPWGPYHMKYFLYRLELEGYDVVNSEEVIVMGFQTVMRIVVVITVLSILVIYNSLVYLFT